VTALAAKLSSPRTRGGRDTLGTDPNDGPGAPLSVVTMKHGRPSQGTRSLLTLRFQVLDDRPDWPVVEVLVDGAHPFAGVAPKWRGFDPAKMLGPQSPLLPVDHGRRVAIYRCSCGEAGCGVIAPVIIPSPDGRVVSWTDFRDYVGVFTGPVEESVRQHEGKTWDLPDLHFDRQQYVEEIHRAAADDSWETPRRKTARLLNERLEPMGLVLPPDLPFVWATPAWAEAGAVLMFQRLIREPTLQVRQQMLRLTSAFEDPVRAADDMASQLLATPAAGWVERFGWSR